MSEKLLSEIKKMVISWKLTKAGIVLVGVSIEIKALLRVYFNLLKRPFYFEVTDPFFFYFKRVKTVGKEKRKIKNTLLKNGSTKEGC